MLTIMSGFLLLINSNYRRKSNMNYNEIRRLYDNVDNDELVTQTAYEFKLFDDYYYQLFYSYSELNKEVNS
jgi:hypothetical protein